MSIASPGMPRRFLFVMWEGGGNVPPILGLARRLAERGHQVRVISDPCNEAEVRAAGCEFTAYSRAPHRNDKSAASTLMKDYEAGNLLASLRTAVKLLWSSTFAQDVLDELRARPVDVCCVNDLLLSACFAAEKMHIPTVLLIPSGNDLFPGPGTSLGTKATSALRAFMFERIVLPQAMADLQNTRTALDLPPMHGLFSYIYQLSKVLIMTSRAFDPNTALAPNYRYIGPILDDPSWTDAWQSPWTADNADPLVVVSLSTTYQRHEEILQKVLDALVGLKIRGLVTLGPTLDPTQFRIPANVVVRQSVAHAQVFPVASAVVTHGGHGTVIRALAHGVPLVCIPLGRDQPANAARVAAKGVGLKLDRKTDIAGIREAVQRVINEREFRERAARLGKIIMTDAHSSSAVQELEQVGGISNLATISL